jgi:hypothetical protein
MRELGVVPEREMMEGATTEGKWMVAARERTEVLKGRERRAAVRERRGVGGGKRVGGRMRMGKRRVEPEGRKTAGMRVGGRMRMGQRKVEERITRGMVRAGTRLRRWLKRMEVGVTRHQVETRTLVGMSVMIRMLGWWGGG